MIRLNTGLFFDRHKVQGTHDLETAGDHHDWDTGSLATNLDVLLRGVLPTSRLVDHCPRSVDHILKGYLREHDQALREECRVAKGAVRNLFIPKSLGGMGVTAPAGWKVKVNTYQKIWAFEKVQSLGGSKSFGLPLPGYELKEVSERVPLFVKKESEQSRPKGYTTIPFRLPWRLLWNPVYLWSPNRCGVWLDHSVLNL